MRDDGRPLRGDRRRLPVRPGRPGAALRVDQDPVGFLHGLDAPDRRGGHDRDRDAHLRADPQRVRLDADP
ncbi:hypothetical protein SGPA1_11727 [Streptomyces misionensis JCM 4497]